MWKQELLEMLEQAKQQINDIEFQLDEFNEMYPQETNIKLKQEEQLLVKVAKLQFDMLLLQAKHSKEFVEAELSRLEYISDKRLSSDTSNIL